MKMIINLNLRSRTPPQKRISQSTKRFNVAAWGRQSGKTTFGLDKMVEKPLKGRTEGIYWYILQTHNAAQIAFERYNLLTRNTPLVTYKNESHKMVTLLNGATLFFKSGQNYEDLRAETLDGCIIDEVRQQHPDLWTKVIRPMLARNKGWCDFYSTPNGFDHFKDIYDNALLNPDEWATFHAPSTEAWWWDNAEVESNRAVMTEDEFAQEILAEFREMGVGKTYKNHSQANQRMDNPFTTKGEQWSPYLPIIVGLDFNVGLMAWELCQNRGQDFYFGDEIALKNTDSAECAKELAFRVKNHKPGIILIGDASGNSRNTKAEAGKTDYTIIENILRQEEIKFENRTPESNPPVKDRVNCMNAALKTADGIIHLWYNPLKCKYLKGDLERVKWKEGAESAILDKSDPLRTHSSDAAGYPVAYYSDLLKKQVGIMRVINR
jgi:hypothetical protein